ncbi:MAG: membrane protein required for colicin V production, partial [Hyphomicrobiaceae bacterium]
ALGAVLFVMVLIVVHLITSKISDSILDSNIGMIDRMLGLVFGVVRGFILIVIPFMLYENFFPEPKQQLPWVRNAITLPYIKDTGQSLRALLVQYIPENIVNPDAPEQQSNNRPLGNHRIVLVNVSKLHVSVTHHTKNTA